MVRCLLDTNICIELIRGRSKSVLARMRRRKIGSIGISTVTLAELQYGVARSSDPPRNAVALLHFCAPLEICDFDDHAAAVYGEVRSHMERSGKPIGPHDTLIAAHALAMKVTLVTNNLREFRRVPKLRVENWVSA